MRSPAPAVLGGSPAFPERLPLVRPTLGDTAAIARDLARVLDSGMLTNGPTVRRLEEEAAAYLQVPHVVAVASCTAGLLLVLQALDLAGRAVVLPSFTFSATAHAVHWVGGEPRFADIEPLALTLDPDDAERRLQGAGALMATHLYGTPCQVERLQQLSAKAGIPLVYDAAHALGSKRRGRPIGGFGSAEVFSLSPTKVAVAGEGGLVATDSAELAEACRLGRDYGNPGDYNTLFPGLNARMSELHATLALASLGSLDERVARRNELVERFAGAVAGLPGVRFPVVDEADTSTYKDLTLLLEPDLFGLGPSALATALRADGVDSRRYYHPPVHRQTAYRDVATPPLPVTDDAASRVLTLPLWSHMSTAQVDLMAAVVQRIQVYAGAVAASLR